MEAYSYSSISLFEKCPRAFRYKYIDGEEEAFTTIEQHLGQVVHDSLERLYASAAQQQYPDLRWLLETYSQLWNSPDLPKHRVVKRGMTASAYDEEGFALIRSYYERVFRNDRSQTLHLEHRFSYHLEDGEEEYRYSGVIDRVSRLSDGTIRITDYKTGRSVPDPAEDLQMRSYALHVLAQLGTDCLQLCFEDLRGGRSITAPFPAREAEGVRSRLLSSIRGIEGETEYPASPSTLCDWCGFNSVCGEAQGARRPRRKPSEREASGATCPRCGAGLEERSGQRGPFIGCSQFPMCRYTRDEW
jgi:RecB family exonuclease